MRQTIISHTYELSVLVNVEVPDEWSDSDIKEYFAEFPISVTVNSHWDNEGAEGKAYEGVTVETLDCGEIYIRDNG